MPEHINTLQQFDDLRASGMPEEQARAHVQALNFAFDGIATKEDLNSLEQRIDAKIDSLEYKLENKIDSKFNMLLMLGGAMFLVSVLPVLERFVKYLG